MFPKDAITQTTELQGAGDFVFDNTTDPKTILGISIQQSGTASDSFVLCGADTIAKNFSKELANVVLNYECNDILKVEKTGNDDAFFIITYVPYKTIAGTTSPTFINGFSYDGILIGLLLFLMFFLMFFGGLWNKIIGIKTKRDTANEIIGNNSQDGKIIYYD